jgi:SAM-dependent methyltransferase
VLTFDDYLRFRREYFPAQTEVIHDPASLCRFAEYEFVCEHLRLSAGDDLVDLACSFNIFQLFLAWSGVRVTGVDIDPGAYRDLEPRLRHVEQHSGETLPYEFRSADALQLPFEDASFDKLISISSVEHMFTDREDEGSFGDSLGLIEARRVVRPGGRLVVTVPMSSGGPFHQSCEGDAHYPEPYRLYTPEAIEERLCSVPGLRPIGRAFVPHRVPVPGVGADAFMRVWMDSPPSERARWEPIAPALATMFQPLIRVADDPEGYGNAHTGLIAFEVIEGGDGP